jgi:hypothetical protein
MIGFRSAARLFAVCAAALIVTPATAQNIAITGGRVVVGDGSPPIEGGTVVILNGRVSAVGKSVAIPAGVERIDATGKWVTPGIVAGFSRLGLAGVDAVDASNDASANGSPFNASIDIAPSVSPDVEAMAVNRAAGVTRAIVSPEASNSIFGGQGAVIDTGADPRPITKARAFQFVEFGEAGGLGSRCLKPRLPKRVMWRAVCRAAKGCSSGPMLKRLAPSFPGRPSSSFTSKVPMIFSP